MKSAWIITGAVIILLVVGGFLLFNNKNSGNPVNNTPSVSSTGGKTYNVDMQNIAFSPTSLTIKVGDSVIWTNKDSVSHTVTSDSGNELKSGTLANGQTYSHTFNTAGEFDYHCSIHPMMKAKIIVQ